ncbi:DUF3180 family protein [Dermabacteraceae bacterium P9123]
MKRTPWVLLLALFLCAVCFSNGVSALLTSFGVALPFPGYLSSVVLFAVAGVLLYLGLKLKWYMQECEERREKPTSAPRKHEIDMTTAAKTVAFATACALAGALAGGVFSGEVLFLLVSAEVSFTGALLPTLLAAISGIVLSGIGYLVEGWGEVPPEPGGNARA